MSISFRSLLRYLSGARDSACARRRQSRRQITEKCGAVPEWLEPRVVPAALSDLTPVLVSGPATAAPGDRLAIHLAVENLGGTAPRYQIQLQLRPVGGETGPALLSTSVRPRIAANGIADWVQKIQLPDALRGGDYRLEILIDQGARIPEANEENNFLAASSTISILTSDLSGRVKAQGGLKPVAIHAVGNSDANLDPTVTTWIVIHGRNQSATSPDLVQLATLIDAYQPGDQVLVLDWQKGAASKGLGGQGENYIQPVALWAAQALKSYGFGGSDVNLVGYSWGAEVAAEMAEVFGQVNSVLAIDPARDYPGGTYNPEAPGSVNLQAHAQQSWAVYASAGLQLGSSIVASTAERSFVLTGSDHFGAVSVVTSLLALPENQPVSAYFLLTELLTGLPGAIWTPDSYAADGLLDPVEGSFDAVLIATVNGRGIASLRYFNGTEEQTLTVT